MGEQHGSAWALPEQENLQRLVAKGLRNYSLFVIKHVGKWATTLSALNQRS